MSSTFLTIVLVLFLIAGLLLLTAGVYLLVNKNKDESQNKDIPQYVKDHMLVSGITFVAVGLILLIVCGILLSRRNSSPAQGISSTSKLGFNFYE